VGGCQRGDRELPTVRPVIAAADTGGSGGRPPQVKKEGGTMPLGGTHASGRRSRHRGFRGGRPPGRYNEGDQGAVSQHTGRLSPSWARRDLNPHIRAFSPILCLSTQVGEESPSWGFHAAMVTGAARLVPSGYAGAVGVRAARVPRAASALVTVYGPGSPAWCELADLQRRWLGDEPRPPRIDYEAAQTTSVLRRIFAMRTAHEG
jgi:hypothetical protein